MTDLRTALLATIRAAPRDDGPRLVYADWLEEQGEAERAEFIRVQIELSQFNAYFDVSRRMPISRSDRLESLHRRELELWEANVADWLPFLPGASQYATHASSVYEGQGTYAVQFGAGHVGELGRVEMLLRRGFGESVRCNWPDWRNHADRILAVHPITHVELTTMPEMEELPPNVWQGYRTRKFRMRSATHAASHVIGDEFFDNVSRAGAHHLLAEYLLRQLWPGVRFTLPSDTMTLTAHRLATAVQVPAELLADNAGAAYAATRAVMDELDRRIWRAVIAEQDWVDGATR